MRFPTHDAVEGYTGFLLRKLSAAMFDSFAERLSPHGLHPMHFGMLSIIASEAPVSQQELCERTGVDPSTMVARMDALEALELVERSRSAKDRRLYEIRMTPKGRRLLKKLQADAADHHAGFFAALDEREREQLHSLLLKVARGLDAP
ncbi:MAG TPA: MarR family transcriptional regulator [Thermoleophilaceae bacterium]|nr:MarR family transcriptional regulator [Thermoleophilaceae bacterium]